jgi:hypothetical protein
MKRKEYQKPQMRLVVLTRRTYLLQSSEKRRSAGVEDYNNNPEEEWP